MHKIDMIRSRPEGGQQEPVILYLATTMHTHYRAHHGHQWRIYTQRLRKKVNRIIKTPTTPATNCSVCCRLAGGTTASGLKPPDSGTVSSHRQ